MKEIIFKNGEYFDLSGNKMDVDVEAFGEDYGNLDLMDEKDFFSKVEAEQHFGDIGEVKKLVEGYQSNGIKRDNYPEVKKIIQDLKFRVKNSLSPLEKIEAMKAYEIILNLDEDTKNKILSKGDNEFNW